MSGRVLQCFINADLRLGHKGLSALAKKYKLSTEKLQPGEFLVFVNGRRDKMKVYAAHEVLTYIQTTHVDLGTIKYIPAAYNLKGHIDYDEALKFRLKAALEEKGTLSDLKMFTSETLAREKRA